MQPGRICFCNVELNESVLEGEEIVVTAGYFYENENNSTSEINFNREEIRRSPGSAGDVSRILMALPSTAQVYDNANDLMVRGGSPFENGFYVDNISIPNINHFAVQGATGGPIGMLNVEFIDDVSFLTGGFSSSFGDRLSSIIDIKLREGNNEEFDGQVDLNMAGFGGVVEGPLPDKKGSWFFSARRSYLDFIVDAIGTGGAAPQYGDAHAKLTYKINDKNKIDVLNIFGMSYIKFDPDNEEGDGSTYGEFFNYQNTTGINWRSLWNTKAYSNTSLSYSFNQRDQEFFETETDELFNNNVSYEAVLSFRNVNFYNFDKTKKLEFGLEIKTEISDFDYYFRKRENRLGGMDSTFAVSKTLNETKVSAFGTFIWNPLPKWMLSFGLRGDYFTFTDRYHIAPRFSTKYKVNERLSLNFATGVFYQTLPAFILSQDDRYKNLKDTRSVHYVLGMDYLLTEDTKLSLEVYDKEYDHFPITPSDPYKFVIDDGRFENFFKYYPDLISTGKAWSRGIELLLQKKLAKDFYGLISASLFRARYRGYNKTWYDRIYDNQYLFSIIGGYKPNNKWEFSVRWTYAGGVPYTPYDVAQSTAAQTGIIDQTKIHAERYPEYHSLNLRADRRFFFEKSSFVIYLSIWNAYNRKNVSGYTWDKVENKPEARYQWSFIPIGGFEYEF